MRRFLYLSCLFLLLSGILGCKPTGKLAVRNFAGQYAEILKTPLLQVVPVSETKSMSHVYARWPYADMLYLKNKGDKLAHASFSLHFELYANFRSDKVLDSGTFNLKDSLHAGSNQMCDFEFNVKAPEGQISVLSLTLIDRNSNAEHLATFYINKREPGSSSFFKASQAESGLLYSPVLYNMHPVVISYANTAVKSLYVSRFSRHFPLPAPPFDTEERTRFDYRPDSSFRISMENGNSAPLHLNGEGIYFFSIDSAFREGFTLFRFSPGFPELTSARQMLIPLRYITSGAEFEKLERSPDIRTAVDSFWIATAGNTDRALMLIHDFYSRVKRVNDLFSSYTEGWQTDRGLIYIIFGSPDVVYRSNFQEEWIYGELRNLRSLHFYFQKAENPFSASDFVLSRDPTLKQAWYMGVERWRR